MERPLAELLALAGRTNRTKSRDQVIRPHLEAGWLALTLPDKPRSPKQHYRLTPLGQEELSRLLEERG